MHKVSALKTISASIVIAFALNYLAAFNLVGWNFLVPGTYTFGISCIILLVIISSAALLLINVSPSANVFVAGAGLALALILASSLIGTEIIAMKDYFIWGFVIAVPVGVYSVLILVKHWHASYSFRAHRSLVQALFLWGVILTVYGVGVLIEVIPDLQSFHRQQLYLLGVAAITSIALLQVSKFLIRKRSKDK